MRLSQRSDTCIVRTDVATLVGGEHVLVDAAIAVEAPAAGLAPVLVLEGRDAPGRFLAVGVHEQREQEPAPGSLVAPHLDHRVGEYVERPAPGLLVAGHELRVEVADRLLVDELPEDAVVVAGLLREAGHRVLPARIVHGLHVLGGELPDRLAVL